MAQNEIFELLKNKRESGIEDYFTIKEIKTMICNNKDCNCSTNESVIRTDVQCLNRHNYLEVTAKGNLWNNWNQCYRIKKKYCNGAKK
jgi:hypothetical protein